MSSSTFTRPVYPSAPYADPVLALALCPQRIVVTALTTHTTVATLSLQECGRTVLGPWRARVGRNGLSTHRREGDGTTPIGTFPIGRTLYGLDASPGGKLRYHRLVCGDWWDEDPRSPSYNRFRHVACGLSPPFGGGSEALWRATVAYREFAVIEFNTHPVVAGLGSGMFLHDDTGGPTNGCVSLRRMQLIGLLRRLRPGATIAIRA
jgi:L,D-peptidoglycan transpeptidase YkuD (ErfK/YbiS/YcfS/YnhG family)